MDLRVTFLERTLVDVLERPDLSGGWEESWRSLASVEFFDLDRVVEYALLLGSATVAARVGLFLSQHCETLMVEESHLDALRKRKPRAPHYLEPARGGESRDGSFISEWNLIVPYEEQSRGWLSIVPRAKSTGELIQAYSRLENHLNYFRRLTVRGFSAPAAVEFLIASIALALDATVVSRNRRDFRIECTTSYC